jgi:uncharacterized protein (DUF433 family)
MGHVIAVFTAEQVARLTGVSRQTLSDWGSLGLFEPELENKGGRIGLSRTYSFPDLVSVKTLQILRQVHKIPKAELAKTALALRVFAQNPWSELTLYVLNKEVHFSNDNGSIVGALSGQKSIAIPLKSVASTMRDEAAKLRSRKSVQLGTIERRRSVASNQETFAGTRIPISLIVTFIKLGRSDHMILTDYPSLSALDLEIAKKRITPLNMVA